MVWDGEAPFTGETRPAPPPVHTPLASLRLLAPLSWTKGVDPHGYFVTSVRWGWSCGCNIERMS